MLMSDMKGTPEELAEAVQNRHPGTRGLVTFFSWSHLPADQATISRLFGWLAIEMVCRLSDGPELTASLRKLLEAKDCAVRQAFLDRKV